MIALAEALLERETLDGDEIAELIETGKLSKLPEDQSGSPPGETSTQVADGDASSSKQGEIFPTPGLGPSPASA